MGIQNSAEAGICGDRHLGEHKFPLQQIIGTSEKPLFFPSYAECSLHCLVCNLREKLIPKVGEFQATAIILPTFQLLSCLPSFV